MEELDKIEDALADIVERNAIQHWFNVDKQKGALAELETLKRDYVLIKIADVPDLTDTYHRLEDIKANLRTYVEFDYASLLMQAAGGMAVAAHLLHTAIKSHKETQGEKDDDRSITKSTRCTGVCP